MNKGTFADFMFVLENSDRISYFTDGIEGTFDVEDYALEDDYLSIYCNSHVVITMDTHPESITTDDEGWYFNYGVKGDVAIACL